MRKRVAIAGIAILGIVGLGYVVNMHDISDELVELDVKAERLLQELKASPVVTVVGVVDAMGAGGGCRSGDTAWTLRFAFGAWRIEDSEVRTDRLGIQRRLSHDKLNHYLDQIKPHSILRARMHLAETTESGKPHGLLIDDVEILASDEKLDEWVIHLQEPVRFEDEMFGTFTLDRRVNWYQAEATWQGARITLRLNANELDDAKESLKTAHALWQSQDKWSRRIREFAIKNLLPLKNETWLEEDESEVTPDQFKERMALESVTVYSDGSFEFWHDDGDLFLGHPIMIRGTLSEGPTEAEIPG